MSNSYQYVVDSDAAEPGDRNGTQLHPADDVDGNPGRMIETDPSLEEVLQSIFGLGAREREIYVSLVASNGRTVQEVADELGRHRSSTNRGLKKLFDKGFVTRKRRILSSGGQVYQYSARPPEDIQAKMLAGLREWSDRARGELTGFVSRATERDRQRGADPADRTP